MISARYKLTFIEATVAVANKDAEIFLLMDDDIFPKQGERWEPIIMWDRQLMRLPLVFVEKMQEISNGTYGLDLIWLEDDGKQQMRFNHALGYDVPMRGKVRLERTEDG